MLTTVPPATSSDDRLVRCREVGRVGDLLVVVVTLLVGAHPLDGEVEVEVDVDVRTVGEPDLDVVAGALGLVRGDDALAGLGQGGLDGHGEVAVWRSRRTCRQRDRPPGRRRRARRRGEGEGDESVCHATHRRSQPDGRLKGGVVVQARSGATVESRTRRCQPMKLLVVEDDLKIAGALRRGLEAEGFTVDVALDGDDGLWMATEGSYDLIVLDIMLPRRNGYVVCATCAPPATGHRS